MDYLTLQEIILSLKKKGLYEYLSVSTLPCWLWAAKELGAVEIEKGGGRPMLQTWFLLYFPVGLLELN